MVMNAREFIWHKSLLIDLLIQGANFKGQVVVMPLPIRMVSLLEPE